MKSGTKTLTLDVETNEILPEITTTIVELTPELVEQLQKIAMYDEYIQNTQLENQINELYSLTIPKINAISFPNQNDILENIPNKQHPVSLKEEQSKDDDIRQVIQWKKWTSTSKHEICFKKTLKSISNI